jgi:C1A family cysteine protease
MGKQAIFVFAVIALVLALAAQVRGDSYDLRDDGYVTPVKNQIEGTCWAHGTIAAMESNLLVIGNWFIAREYEYTSNEYTDTEFPYLSEYHLDWWNGFNQHNNDDTDPPTGAGLEVHMGGDYRVATAYMTRGEGAVRGFDVEYEDSFYEPPPRDSNSYHKYYPRHVEWYVLKNDLSNIESIKDAIRTHGALGTALRSADNFYSSFYNSYYQPPSNSGNPGHAVAIVGWDDEKVTQAPQAGAWLCKNSWGTYWGEQGYFWISYYDKHCCRHPEMGAVSFQDVELLTYDHIYYHDCHGWRETLTSASEAFNAFNAMGQKPITAVSFYTAADNVNYTVRIYDRFEGGELLDELSVKSGSIQYTGFHTIDLDTPVFLEENDDFYVYVNLSAGGHAYDCSSYIEVLLNQPSPQPPFEDDLPEEPASFEAQWARGGEFRELGKMDLSASSPGVFVESSSSPGQSYYLSSQGRWPRWVDAYYHLDETANFCIKALSGEVVPPSPRVISPTDGACGVSTDVVFSWTIGPDADSYDLYLGVDFDDVYNATTGSADYMGRYDVNSYNPGRLQEDATYYWRIDDVNAADPNSPYKGDVWSFTTSEIVYYVPDDYPTIQEAIDLACDGATIIVAEGTYYENIIIEGKSLAIISTDPNDPNVVAATVIDGDKKGSVVQFSDCGPDVIFSGFTIVNGESRDGGGVYCSYSDLIITNCVFSGNSATRWRGEGPEEGMFGEGGGIYCSFSNLIVTNCTFTGDSGWRGGGIYGGYSNATITNCSFSGNSAESGGGMYNACNNRPTVTNCTFGGNSAQWGGGMSNNFSNPIVTNCNFSGNSGDGGGMYNKYSNPIIANCTFSTNSGVDGGGMYNRSSNPIITNCAFSGNSALYGGGMYAAVDEGSPSDLTLTSCTFNGNAADYGGGMFISWPDVTMTMTNCTFNGNSADYGGGIYSATHSRLTITNCIFWGNTARTEPQIRAYVTDSTTVTYSEVQGGWPGEGNIDADPCFVDADGADNIVGTEDDIPSLLPGSACADAGNNDVVPADVIFDLYGDPRFADDPYAPDTGHGTAPIVDMGAYEGAKQGFVLSTESVAVPEGQTATFTVALVLEPAGTVQVNVTFQSGDPDITVQSGALLTFDPYNYSVPQTVVLAAAEDGDRLNNAAVIGISAPGFINQSVMATELDNESNPNVLFVDASAAGGNSGTNWPNAFTDLQEALHLAAEYPQFEQVLVAEGVYTPAPPGGDQGATFQLVSGVAVYGGFPTGGGSWQDRDPDVHKTILSGDLNGDDGPDFANNGENSRQVVTSERAIETTVLDGFIITGGSWSGMYNLDYANPTIRNCILSANAGEGMYNGGHSSPTVTNCMFSVNADGGMRNNSDSSPTITNCTFSGNSATRGGGMRNSNNSSPTVINCTFSGNSAGRGGGMYNVTGSSPTVTDCTFTGNWAEETGGGMYNQSFSSSFTNCTFTDNWAEETGGGMYNQSFSSSFTNCTFTDNSAKEAGGGMYNRRGSPSFTHCTFSGNSAVTSGGGMYNEQSEPTLTNCTFNDNSANEDGGGMLNRDSSCPILTNCTFSGNYAVSGGGMGNDGDSNPELSNCVFSNNSAERGGGMDNDRVSSPTLTNCIFYDNSAENGGGILNKADSSPILTNCTFSANSAQSDGGAISNNESSSPTVTNCILWGNAAPSGAQIYNDGTSSATVRYSDIQGVWRGTGNTNADPLFIDASSGDLHLLPASLCIDAGDPSSYFGLEPEPDGARINMGAYGNTPEATCKGGLVLKSYNMVSKVRNSRTTFKYEFTVTLNNNSAADLYNLQLEMLDASGNVVMLDSEVNFGYIAAGETATSEDTFSLSVDRAIPIDLTTISWHAEFRNAGE